MFVTPKVITRKVKQMKTNFRFFAVAVVLAGVVAGSIFSVYNLSAQDPPTETPVPLATVVVQHATAITEESVTYCDPRTDGISVQGVGLVTLPATIGVVVMGVDVTADTVSEARSTAATTMTAVIDAVTDKGIADDEITTTQLNIWPETSWVEEQIDLGDGQTGRRNKQVVTGYRVTNRVRIEVDLTQTESEDDSGDFFGEVIDAAAEAGGDKVRVDSISFTADQSQETVDEARMLAAEDALHRAELYAEAFGVEVGTLLSASESLGAVPVFAPVAEARLATSFADSATTPINAGDVEIRANINAKFAIVQPNCVDASSGSSNDD